MSRVLFRNAALVDATTRECRADRDVLVEGARIREVSPAGLACDDARVIDLAGRTLMPGLIDAHAHVTGPEMSPANGQFAPSEIAVQAARYLEDMLARGFTSIREAGGADWGLARAVERGLIRGPKLYYSGRALTARGGGGDFRPLADVVDPCGCPRSSITLSAIADGVDEVRKAAREELRKGATQIKVFASGGVVFSSPSGRTNRWCYSEDELRAVVEEAAAWGAYVMAHAYTPEAIRRCIECGVRTIEHGNFLDEETALLMAQRGAFLVPTLITLRAMADHGASAGGTFAKLDDAKIDGAIEAGRNAIRMARRHGVKIGFGTDLWGEEGHARQLEEFLLRAPAEDAWDTIASATAVNAEILGRAGELGVIAPGARADLIVVEGDPLGDVRVLVDPAANLALVMRAGAVVVDHRFGPAA